MLSMPAASSDPACCKLLPADMQIQLMLSVSIELLAICRYIVRTIAVST